jgi:putative aldouronate transport system permease protein
MELLPVVKKKRRSIDMSLYVMLLPAVILVAIYSYGPLVGLTLAFEKFRLGKSIFTQQWVGLDNFKYLFFGYSKFGGIIWNTIFISAMKLVGGFIMPIIVSILLNEIAKVSFKRTVQTMIYLPYFISWVVISGILIDILSPTDGAINQLIQALGMKPVFFLGTPKIFPYVLVASDMWKNFGFGTIMYMAALTSIDPCLYEAAVMDGAKRIHRIRYITIPGIVPIMVLLGTLSLGYLMNAGFDQVFNLYNPSVYSTGEILDTFTYQVGIVGSRFDYATAVGLFKSVVSMILVSTSYFMAHKLANYKIF